MTRWGRDSGKRIGCCQRTRDCQEKVLEKEEEVVEEEQKFALSSSHHDEMTRVPGDSNVL
jgi:hypothetical protein